MPKYQFAVEVLPEYLPEESEPEREVFAFAYTITITNTTIANIVECCCIFSAMLENKMKESN